MCNVMHISYGGITCFSSTKMFHQRYYYQGRPVLRLMTVGQDFKNVLLFS